jgi:hypothetical protein
MIRLGISVEGATEREFVNGVLRQHLANHNVDVKAIDLRGNVSLDKIRHHLPPLLSSFERVSTFYDYYGFKNRTANSAEQLEQEIRDLVNVDSHHRFIPYVQCYEFEALLFAVPVQTVEWLQGNNDALQEMQDAVRRAGNNPERVNDSPQTSPSHRLKRLFNIYDKKLHGPEIIAVSGLAIIREQCPRFSAWIAQLEALGA